MDIEIECPGCHNATIHQHGEGKWFSVITLAESIFQKSFIFAKSFP